MLRVRTGRPVGHIPPCLPSRVERPPTGPGWLHEIKHDGFRLMARRNGARSSRAFAEQERRQGENRDPASRNRDSRITLGNLDTFDGD
jgi:hypothetical protein